MHEIKFDNILLIRNSCLFYIPTQKLACCLEQESRKQIENWKWVGSGEGGGTKNSAKSFSSYIMSI